MRQTTSIHEVTSVTIGPSVPMTDHAYREITVTLHGGETMRFTLFSEGEWVPVVIDGEVK